MLAPTSMAKAAQHGTADEAEFAGDQHPVGGSDGVPGRHRARGEAKRVAGVDDTLGFAHRARGMKHQCRGIRVDGLRA